MGQSSARTESLHSSGGRAPRIWSCLGVGVTAGTRVCLGGRALTKLFGSSAGAQSLREGQRAVGPKNCSAPARPLARQPRWRGEAPSSWPLCPGKEPGGSQGQAGSSPWAPASWGCSPCRGAVGRLLGTTLQHPPPPPRVPGLRSLGREARPAGPRSSSLAPPPAPCLYPPGVSLAPSQLLGGQGSDPGPRPTAAPPPCLGAGAPCGGLLGRLGRGGVGAGDDQGRQQRRGH